MTEPLPHLLVNGDWTAAERFKSKGSGPRSKVDLGRNRFTHGKAVLDQMQAVRPSFEQALANQHQADIEQYGLVVEFDLAATGEEPLASLEDLRSPRRGIRLLSAVVRDEVIRAQVFVPEGKLDVFEKKILEYLDPTKDSKNKNGEITGPKNKRLVEHILRIRLATFESLWTDSAPIPEDEEARWWEVWLWLDPALPDPLECFRRQAEKIGIAVSDWTVRFPERLITTVFATKAQFSESIHFLNCLAEIRLHRDQAEFIRRLPNREQFEWAQDVAKRVVPPGEDGPAICILDSGANHLHPLLADLFPGKRLGSVTICETVHDEAGHGTSMAGIAGYGDLAPYFSSENPIEFAHHLESVKIIKRDGDNAGRSHGAILERAAGTAEGFGEHKPRIYCLALSNPDVQTDGIPSSQSAVLDKLAFGRREQGILPRLFTVCAGNVQQSDWAEYPTVNHNQEIHDPGQSWNALTIGAYTEKDGFNPEEYPGWKLIADRFDLAPSSSTSLPWTEGTLYGNWPYKPDVVFEGGNGLVDPEGQVSADASLSLITTHYRPHLRHFEDFGDTSAATALAARMAAIMASEYPDYWPETIRALIVHSARWTKPMVNRFLGPKPDAAPKQNVKALLRCCGYGVPSLSTALHSLRSHLTLVFQEEIQPFGEFEAIDEKGKKKKQIETNEMVLHRLPWPADQLKELGNEEVRVRVTLSYFIEPNPSHRGRDKRYRYESCGLRFRLKPSDQSLADFRHSVNNYAKEMEDGDPLPADDQQGWMVGSMGRTLGSVHSDCWCGPAIQLANRDCLAVYPTMGWWRTVKRQQRWNEKLRYSVIVSIETKRQDVDLYAPVKALLEVPVPAEAVVVPG